MMSRLNCVLKMSFCEEKDINCYYYLLSNVVVIIPISNTGLERLEWFKILQSVRIDQ